MIPSGREPLVERLLAAGLLTEADARGAGLQTETRARYTIAVVSVDGAPRFVVKQARSDDVVPLLASERRTLRRLEASGMPGLAPRVADITGEDAALVVGHLDRSDVDAGQEPERAALALAVTLARLHRSSLDTGSGRGPEGADECPPSVVPTLLLPQLKAAAERHPATAASMHMLATTWHPGVLIHGDVKWEHVRRGAALIDWELAGWGDPVWDVAALLHELCIAGATSLVLGRVLHGYRQDVGRSLGGYFLRRCRAALSVRCMQSAIEYESAGADPALARRASHLARWWAEHPGALEHCLAEAA